MNVKIFKANGEVVLWSTLRGLMIKEKENTAHIEPRRNFSETCKNVLGPKGTLGNFMPEELTPECELYTDDYGQEGTADAPPEDLEPTPKANNNYVNVNIMLPRGR